MATFRSVADLRKYTEQQAHNALEQVAQQVLEEWKYLVKKRVYEDELLKARPNNQNYRRTGQLLDSLELVWINPLMVQLDYNREKILPSMMLNRFQFNRHTSFNGTDVSMWIPTFIEKGNGDSEIYSYDGIHAHEEILKMLNQDFQTMMKKALENQLK